MDIRSKPMFVPHGHHLLFAFLLVCLFACLFAFLLVFLFSCFLTFCLPYLSCLSALYPLHMLFSSFPSIACLFVSCLCLCMYTHAARTHGAKAQSPRFKQKGRRCKHVDISQVAMFSRFRDLVSHIWLCTLLKPLPSFSISLLDGLY